jgi:CMP/dCMP kinase
MDRTRGPVVDVAGAVETRKTMIVTIDGPAGTGKSSVAQQLAERLGFQFLDTGAMYRAMTFAALEARIDLHDPKAVAQLAAEVEISQQDNVTLVNGIEVSNQIRTEELTAKIRFVADNSAARDQLVTRQRQVAQGRDIVTEGRDQGTVAFPNAACKFFLTASLDVRTDRRCAQLEAKRMPYDRNTVRAQIELRDREDAHRKVGRLVAAADALTVNTDSLTQSQVVDMLEKVVRERMRELGRS